VYARATVTLCFLIASWTDLAISPRGYY